MGGIGALRRRALLRCLPWALVLPLPLPLEVQAVRVTDVPLYATLACAAVATRDARECRVAEGSHVELVGEVSGPGVVPGADRRWFARVISGPCSGAELSLLESCLRDQRSVPEPSPAASRPR